MSGETKRLHQYLEGRREAMTALLERLVRAESPSLHAPSQARVLDIVNEAFAARGYRCRRLRGDDTGGHIFARPAQRPRGCSYQLLIGHCDTVWPLGTVAERGVTVDGNRLHGPGAYDMKAGLVQMVFALEALHELGVLPTVTAVALVNSDEEIGSQDSGRFIRRLAKRADRAFVLEPSLGPSGDLKVARKGVGRFTVTIQGRAAHAGLDPEKGASAILELSLVIQNLFALNDPARGVTVNVGLIDGGLRPNVVAPSSRAVVDVRVLTHEDAQRIETSIRALQPTTPGTRLEIEGGMGRPPMELTAGNLRLWKLARQAASELGITLSSQVAGGGSDANTTSLYIPTLDGLGAVGDGAHATHEFVELCRMAERAALLATLLTLPALNLKPPAPAEATRQDRRHV